MRQTDNRFTSVGVAFGITMLAVIVTGFTFGLWKLWTWVVPAMFTTAPNAIKYPSFWVFFGLVMLVNLLRGSGSKGGS